MHGSATSGEEGDVRMEVDRRTMLAGAAAAMMAAPGLAKGKSAAANWYDRAIIIDALGGLNDPYAPNDQLRLSDRVWSEMLATGVNVLRDTVMPVGNVPDAWGDFQKDLQGKKDVLNANPDRLILVRTAADILQVGEKRGEVAGLRNHRSGRRPEPDPHLARQDSRQRRLA